MLTFSEIIEEGNFKKFISAAAPALPMIAGLAGGGLMATSSLFGSPMDMAKTDDNPDNHSFVGKGLSNINSDLGDATTINDQTSRKMKFYGAGMMGLAGLGMMGQRANAINNQVKQNLEKQNMNSNQQPAGQPMNNNHQYQTTPRMPTQQNYQFNNQPMQQHPTQVATNSFQQPNQK